MEIIKIHALAIDPLWQQLKHQLTEHTHFSLSLYFPEDWETCQYSHLGHKDNAITLIVYINFKQHLNLDAFKLPPTKSKPMLNLDKLQKQLSPHKKFIEWSISSSNHHYNILLELDFAICPRTCENFWQICTNHPILSYKSTRFHRAVANYYIEGGIIENEIKSIYRESFSDENYRYLHDRAGVIGMSKGDDMRNGTAFYITLRPIKYFDGKFVAFGRVVAGLDAVRDISKRKCVNQCIEDEVRIVESRDFFEKRKIQEVERQNTGFREIANEVLKYI